MDIGENGICYLTVEEQRATGLSSPIAFNAIAAANAALVVDLYERRDGIEAQQAMDDDELTHSERAALVPAAERLRRDLPVVEAMAAQVTAHQAMLSLK